ncbi:hypothetical protein [Rhizobium lentis]|nr:hypothetical protein [Rhizobium lentis]
MRRIWEIGGRATGTFILVLRKDGSSTAGRFRESIEMMRAK